MADPDGREMHEAFKQGGKVAMQAGQVVPYTTTPRWTAYDRAKFKLDLPADVPLQTRERAYTSPIWYNPQ